MVLCMQALRAAVKRYFPKADGEMCKAVACMFTNTPDKQFIVDFHPQHPQASLDSAELHEATIILYMLLSSSILQMPSLTWVQSASCRFFCAQRARGMVSNSAVSLEKYWRICCWKAPQR